VSTRGRPEFHARRSRIPFADKALAEPPRIRYEQHRARSTSSLWQWAGTGGGSGVVRVRNLYRLRLEAPEGFQNQLFTFLDPGNEHDDTRLALLAVWHDRGLKAALEPVLQSLTRDYQDVRVPSGARLEDFVQALDAAVAAMPESALAGFDLGLVLCIEDDSPDTTTAGQLRLPSMTVSFADASRAPPPDG